MLPSPSASPVGSVVANKTVVKDSPDHQNWLKPAAPKLEIQGGINQIQVLPVSIAGHGLSPAIANRQVLTGTPDQVTIRWPNQ